MKNRYAGLDPAMEKAAERYASAQQKFAENGAPLFDLRDPTTRAYFVAMRSATDPWKRTIDRLNANVPIANLPGAVQ